MSKWGQFVSFAETLEVTGLFDRRLENLPQSASGPGVREEASTQYFTAEEGSWRSFAEEIHPSSYSALTPFTPFLCGE